MRRVSLSRSTSCNMDMDSEIQKILDTSATPIAALKALHSKLLKLAQTGAYPPGSAWAWMVTIENHIERLQERPKKAQHSRSRRSA
jgi:hypothetical protein